MIRLFTYHKELFQNLRKVHKIIYSRKGAFCDLPKEEALHIINVYPDIYLANRSYITTTEEIYNNYDGTKPEYIKKRNNIFFLYFKKENIQEAKKFFGDKKFKNFNNGRNKSRLINQLKYIIDIIISRLNDKYITDKYNKLFYRKRNNNNYKKNNNNKNKINFKVVEVHDSEDVDMVNLNANETFSLDDTNTTTPKYSSNQNSEIIKFNKFKKKSVKIVERSEDAGEDKHTNKEVINNVKETKRSRVENSSTGLSPPNKKNNKPTQKPNTILKKNDIIEKTVDEVMVDSGSINDNSPKKKTSPDKIISTKDSNNLVISKKKITTKDTITNPDSNKQTKLDMFLKGKKTLPKKK